MFTERKCEHGLVFNYAGGKSCCGDCGAELIKTAQGQYLNVDALEDMYEALKDVLLLHSADFETLNRGIGTSTTKGKWLLAAKQALAKKVTNERSRAPMWLSVALTAPRRTYPSRD